MAKREIVAGATDQTIDVFIQDSSSSVGAGLTGLVFNTASLTCYYRKGATGTPTALTLATQTVGGAHSDGGFVAVDGTNCPGQYRLDLSDTIVAAAGMVTLYLRGATNMAPCVVEIEIVAVNKFDAVRGGLTALPNANAEAAGGLYTRGSGAGQINQANNGQIDANAARTGGTTNTGRDIGASVLLSPGTGAGQISLASGAVTAGTVSDKTGYSLSQSFPSNFASLGINASGHVSRVTLADSLTAMAGTITTLDALDTAQDAQHAVTQGTLGTVATTSAEAAANSAAGAIRNAVGLATASLDTQLADVPTVAEMTARTLAAASYATAAEQATAATAIADVPTVAEFDARTLAAASYATAANQTAIKAVSDKLDTAVQLDGAVYRFTTNALEQAPTGSGGGGGTVVEIPVNQMPVPSSRTWILQQGDATLIQTATRILPAGTTQLFAIDFYKDLAANGRLTAINSLEIITVDGVAAAVDEDGVTWSLVDAVDAGVDRSQAKVKFTGVTAASYVLEIVVQYSAEDGGGTGTARVTLKVTD